MSSSKVSSNIRLVKNAKKSGGIDIPMDNNMFSGKVINLNLFGDEHSTGFLSPVIEYQYDFDFSNEDFEETVKFIKFVINDFRDGSDQYYNYYHLLEILKAINSGKKLYSNKSPFRDRKVILDKMLGKNALFGQMFTIEHLEGKRELIPTELGKTVARIGSLFPYVPYKSPEFNAAIEKRKEAANTIQLNVTMGGNIFALAFTGKMFNKKYLCFSTYSEKKDIYSPPKFSSDDPTVKTIIFSPNFEIASEFNDLVTPAKDDFDTIKDSKKKKDFMESAQNQIATLMTSKTVALKPALLSGGCAELVLTGSTKNGVGDNSPFYIIMSSPKLAAILKMTEKDFDDIEFRVGGKDLNENNKRDERGGYLYYPLIIADKKTKEVIAVTQESELFVQNSNIFFNKFNSYDQKGLGKSSWYDTNRIPESISIYKQIGLIDI